MKKLKFFAALCCVAAAFAACEPQNGPDNGQNGNNDQNGDNGTAANTENGYEWVDLGLSVKWATHNVGAVRPEGSGDYFAWGETEPKSSYSESNYSYSSNPSVLPLDRDAARANWGGAWRMPTDAEWTELREKCAWKWTDDYKGIGVHGYIVTSLTNGNAIFLPAAGYRYDDDLRRAGSNGRYWSSSLYSDYPDFAWDLYFTSGSVYRNDDYRYYGQSVRPVLFGE
ncbi:MAG: hypothetical protein ACI392_01560 [Paludibacteraceae bacterium]